MCLHHTIYLFLNIKKNSTHSRGRGKCGIFIKHPNNPLTCDVVHYDCSSRVSNVTWDEATKTLLPRRVPQLQPDLWGRKGKGMGGEIKEEKTPPKKTNKQK